MGCVSTKDSTTTTIDQNLAASEKSESIVKKLLLLGIGSAGKSTLFRQLKCLHGSGLDEQDMEESVFNTRYNIVSGMLTLLYRCAYFYEFDSELYGDLYLDADSNQTIKQYTELVIKYKMEEFQNPEELNWDELKLLGKAIKALWSLPPIQKMYKMRYNNFAIYENLHHFLNKADEIFLQNFIPTTEDTLLTRVRTTGVVSKMYSLQGHTFHVVDVGGQRNERKKWIFQFANVTAVIFVAALNHYNCVMFEDEERNSMHESLELFSEICSNKWFKKTEMVLFLNKYDLFEQLLRQGKSLAACFSYEANWRGPEYWISNYGGPRNIQNGANEYFVPKHLKESYEEFDDKPHIQIQDIEKNLSENELKDLQTKIFQSRSSLTPRGLNDDSEMKDITIEEQESFYEHCREMALQFIIRQYMALNDNSMRRIFTHITTAIDSQNVENVFWDVQDIVIRSNMRKGGIVL